jgi:hypothetical protein
MQARRGLGSGRGHNGSNERQNDRCRYANPSYGDATGETLNRHFRFDKQMSVRELVKGKQHHGFVHPRRQLPRKRPCDLRRAIVAVA